MARNTPPHVPEFNSSGLQSWLKLSLFLRADKAVIRFLTAATIVLRTKFAADLVSFNRNWSTYYRYSGAAERGVTKCLRHLLRAAGWSVNSLLPLRQSPEYDRERFYWCFSTVSPIKVRSGGRIWAIDVDDIRVLFGAGCRAIVRARWRREFWLRCHFVAGSYKLIRDTI